MATTKGFNPPGEIVLEGNLSETWARWKKEFMVYLTASESKSKPDDVKTYRLLSAIGPKAREIYYTFTFEEEDDAMKFDNVIERFDQYFTPKKNVTYMRYKFFSCKRTNPARSNPLNVKLFTDFRSHGASSSRNRSVRSL